MMILSSETQNIIVIWTTKIIQVDLTKEKMWLQIMKIFFYYI